MASDDCQRPCGAVSSPRSRASLTGGRSTIQAALMGLTALGSPARCSSASTSSKSGSVAIEQTLRFDYRPPEARPSTSSGCTAGSTNGPRRWRVTALQIASICEHVILPPGCETVGSPKSVPTDKPEDGHGEHSKGAGRTRPTVRYSQVPCY